MKMTNDLTSAVFCGLVLATVTLRTEAMGPAVPDEVRALMDQIFEKRAVPKAIYAYANMHAASSRPAPSGFPIPDKTIVPSDPHPLPQPPPPPTTITPPVDVNCVTTGPSCIKSCRGKPNGNYQSCRGCDVYITCSNSMMYPDRRCPSGLVWNDETKRCDWRSKTCVSCPPEDRSSNFYINLREDILGVGDEDVYKWGVRPEESPSNDKECVRQGTLMVRPPKCTSKIRVFLEFKDPQGYSFHASHLVFADGWAGFDGSGHYGMPGMELHTYDRNMYGFLMTTSTSDCVYFRNDTLSDVVYLHADLWGFVNNFAGVSQSSSLPLRPTSDVFFIGVNRVVSSLFGDAARSGSGLCSLWINCIC